MTDYNDKARAVILAALMVFSVFAGTVALSGTAAATAENIQVQGLTNNQPTEGDTVTHELTYNVDNVSKDGNNDAFFVELPNEYNQSAGTLAVNSESAENRSDGSGISDSSSITRVDGPDGDGTTDTIKVEYSPTGGGTVDMALTVNFDLTHPQVSSNTGKDVTIYVNDSDTGSGTTDVQTTQTAFTVQDISSSSSKRAGPGGSGSFDVYDGEGTVYDGANVYQGETDLELGGSISGGVVKTAGNDEGVTLEVPDIPQDQATGRYTTNGSNNAPGVTVQRPRVTTLDVDNQYGEDIAGGSVPQGNASTGSGNLTVVGAWNYRTAEALELTVENENGLNVTGTAVNNGNIRTATSGDVNYDVDLSDLNTGTFTFTLEGTDDLDFGAASQSTTVTVTGDDDVTLDLDQTTATRGQDVTYTIRGSNAGQYHIVTIEDGDFRSNSLTESQLNKTFRNVGDTKLRGYSGNGYAYAVVEIDDDTGVGVGQIDTSNLDDSSIDVNLYEASSSQPTTESQVESDVSTLSEEDDPSLTVEQGDVSIEQPGNTYVVGSEIDLNGTASEGIDDVAFYVRRQNRYQLVDLNGNGSGIQSSLNVDADETFEKEDIVLSAGEGDGNDLLSQPGSYRLGVIDAADVGGTGNISSDVSVSDFNTGTSGQKSLRVTDTELSANFRTVGGQVSVDDRVVNVTGSSLGSNTVAFVFVDERGNTHYTDITVDDDNTFDEDDLNIGSNLQEGQVSAHVLTTGRDSTFGDGGIESRSSTGDAYDDLDQFASDLNNQSLTGQQVRSRLLDETTEATASDDRMVTTRFRLTDSRTTIRNVYPDGMQASGVNPVGVDDEMVVEGRTNLRPDDNSITVELLTQDGDSVALTTTEDWGYDGMYEVSIELEDVQTGTYTLEADDSYNSDTVEVEIVQSVETATPEPTPTEEPTATPTATAEPTPEPTPEPTEEPTATATPTPTEGGGPGFGALVAVIALIAAALLAVRRDD